MLRTRFSYKNTFKLNWINLDQQCWTVYNKAQSLWRNLTMEIKRVLEGEVPNQAREHKRAQPVLLVFLCINSKPLCFFLRSSSCVSSSCSVLKYLFARVIPSPYQHKVRDMQSKFKQLIHFQNSPTLNPICAFKTHSVNTSAVSPKECWLSCSSVKWNL